MVSALDCSYHCHHHTNCHREVSRLNKNDKWEGVIGWFRDESNIRNIQTGSTIFFIFVFILYFYGFRTGFQFHLIDPYDIVADMLIIMVASVLIIHDFAQRGVFAELQTNDEVKTDEEDHAKVVEGVNIDHMAKGLMAYNRKEIEEKQRAKREHITTNLKRRIRIAENHPKVLKYLMAKEAKRIVIKPKRMKRVEKLQEKLAHFENPDTVIHVKHRYIKESELLTKGIGERTQRDIETNYNPARSVLKNQTGFVITLTIFLPVLRLALDPSWSSMVDFIIFITLLVPILLSRAITSYLAARYNTANKYRYAIRKKVRIIKWCMAYQQPIQKEGG